MPPTAPSIFINYRRADSGYAVGRIYDCLCKAFGREAVFCDFDSIPKGADFPDSIRAVLTDCRVVLPVVGKDWLRMFQERNPPGGGAGPDWVRKELEIAIGRWETEADGQLLVYPLLLLDAKMPLEGVLPPALCRLPRLNGDPIRVDPDFQADIERVVHTIGKHLSVEPSVTAMVGGARLSPPHALETIRWAEELRTYGEGFVGREEELEALDRAWDDGRVRVFAVWADGGEGKTRLVVKWLTRVRDDGWRGAGQVLIHSFYSQGCDERGNASSDFFFADALRYFGYDGPPIRDATERGRKLASLVAERNGLLVLDGLEPLQHPRSFDEGRLKDAAIRALVLSLSNASRGLCLITSRQPVVELRDRTGAAVVQQELNRLDPIAGSALLRQLSVHGTERELRTAVEEYHGHAYSLMLLGTYLGETLDHDIRRRGEIPLLDESDGATRLPGHSRRMFSAYVRHLGEQSPEVAVLRLLGFFDRAAKMELIEVLRKGDSDDLRHIIAPLAILSTKQWQRVLSRLSDLRLIHFHEQEATDDGSSSGSVTVRSTMDVVIDSHALLREYFAEELRTRFAVAWRAGHRRVYEHLTATTEHQPTTLDALQPLYQAVAHGCLAGLHEKARADVYVPRILRGSGPDGFYSWKKLGAIAANLGAVACFFETPWTAVSPNLAPDDQTWLLNEAANYLRFSGRLTEAVAPMQAGVDGVVELKDWRNAAIQANNLSELKLTLGAVSAAVAAGEQSVMYADRSADKIWEIGTRTTLAEALYQAGRIEEARRLFEKAEAIQAEREPLYPRLHSLRGFRYCDLLLSAAERAAWRALVCSDLSELSVAVEPPSFGLPAGAGKERVAPPRKESEERGDESPHSKTCADVIERADYAFKIAEGCLGLLDIALDHLTLGRAAMYRAVLDASHGGQLQAEIQNPQSTVQNHLDAAVIGLRAAGQMQFLSLGLLSHSWLRFLLGDSAGGCEDLDEACDIAERGPMPLFQADILLHRARLFSRTRPYPWPGRTARADLASAGALIKEHGYHRRDGELADAEDAPGDRPP